MYLQAMQCQCGGRQSHHRRYGVPSAPPADTSSGRKSVFLPERLHTASFIRSAGYDRAFCIFRQCGERKNVIKTILISIFSYRPWQTGLPKPQQKRCTNMCARQSGDMPPMNRFPSRIYWLRNIGHPSGSRLSFPTRPIRKLYIGRIAGYETDRHYAHRKRAMYPHASVCGLMFRIPGHAISP